MHFLGGVIRASKESILSYFMFVLLLCSGGDSCLQICDSLN